MSKLIPDILGLINDVYGCTANPARKRQKLRDRTRKFIESRIAEMDKTMAALK